MSYLTTFQSIKTAFKIRLLFGRGGSRVHSLHKTKSNLMVKDKNELNYFMLNFSITV